MAVVLMESFFQYVMGRLASEYQQRQIGFKYKGKIIYGNEN